MGEGGRMRLPGKGKRSHQRTAVTKLGTAKWEHFVGWKGAGAARKGKKSSAVCVLSVCLLHNNQHGGGQVPELIAAGSALSESHRHAKIVTFPALNCFKWHKGSTTGLWSCP